MRWALLVIACGGCDYVFNLDHIPDPADAPVCATGDEDCDGRANDVDLCPADVDDKSDGDADGVGNACDPDAMSADNRIAYFDGFDNNNGNWVIKSGAWQLGGGTFTQPVIGDSGVEKAIAVTRPSVEIIVPDFATTGNGYITLFGSAGGSDLRCSVIRDDSGMELVQIAGVLVATQQQPLTGTGPLRLVGGQHADTSLYCRARHGTNFDVEVTNGSFGVVTTDTIGIKTSSASATVSSITVYGMQ